MSTTEEFSLDERFKKADFIRNMRLLDEAVKNMGTVHQPKKANSKKRRRK